MTIRTTCAVVMAAGLTLSLSGCLEKPEQVELHQPGEYMGPSDPLLQVAGTDDNNRALAERIKSIQTDR